MQSGLNLRLIRSRLNSLLDLITHIVAPALVNANRVYYTAISIQHSALSIQQQP